MLWQYKSSILASFDGGEQNSAGKDQIRMDAASGVDADFEFENERVETLFVFGLQSIVTVERVSLGDQIA